MLYDCGLLMLPTSLRRSAHVNILLAPSLQRVVPAEIVAALSKRQQALLRAPDDLVAALERFFSGEHWLPAMHA